MVRFEGLEGLRGGLARVVTGHHILAATPIVTFVLAAGLHRFVEMPCITHRRSLCAPRTARLAGLA